MIKYMPFRHKCEGETPESYFKGLAEHIEQQMVFLFEHYAQRVAKPLEAEQLTLFDEMVNSITSQKETILIEGLFSVRGLVEDMDSADTLAEDSERIVEVIDTILAKVGITAGK